LSFEFLVLSYVSDVANTKLKIQDSKISELDRTSYSEFRDSILAASQEQQDSTPRSYPGYPRVALDAVPPRLWPSLDKGLLKRRCVRKLSARLPSRRVLSRILKFSHGVHADEGRGSVPTAGGLQGLELYLATFDDAWLECGVYHYDRAGHFLSRVSSEAKRSDWESKIPSISQVSGGSLVWIIVGDNARVAAKYGERGYRFLLLEAGHLMQNLCVLSSSLGLSTVPLGGCFENEIARTLRLPKGDAVLYVGVCGKI
jgi:SagB-type dehydrogenase family enzyme